MKVRMLATITGTARDWPDPGGEIDLPDAEAAQVCNLGLAVPILQTGQADGEDEPPGHGKPAKGGGGRRGK